MIDIQMVGCFNTRSPVLHLLLPIQCQIHNSPTHQGHNRTTNNEQKLHNSCIIHI